MRSDKLTVRKKAIVISQVTTDGGRLGTECSFCTPPRNAGHPASGSPANETVGNRSSAFKPAARTERGDSRSSTRDQGTAGGAGALNGHGFDFSHQRVERNGAAPMEQLARELLGARTGALKRHQQSGFHLRLCPRDFRCIDG